MSSFDDTTASAGLFDGRYRIIRRLGSGGMARVFLAEDVDLHREVAIKVLADRYAEDAEFVERFAREARAAAGLNHQNIVAIYDRGKADGSYYIAMEYLDGETLKDVITRQGALQPRKAIDITLQLLAALRFAHKRDIVHRDVKPHNVMVLRDGRIKVADFGIARAGDSEMTEVGSIVGTAQYLSPEQARGQQVGPASDLYSVGVVLYEMLTGRVPFTGDSAVSIAMKQVQEVPVPPRQIDPSIPVELEQVVLRAMQKDPVHRYRSADEMGMDLDRIRKGLGVAAETAVMAGRTMIAPPPIPSTAPHALAAHRDRAPAVQDRRTWPWIVALLLIVGVAGLAAWAFLKTGSGGGTPTTSTASLVTVKSVIGFTVDAAQSTLGNDGFSVTVKEQFNHDHPKGEVIDQTPRKGTPAPFGSAVAIVVSKGQDLREVPPVTNKDYNTARDLLHQAGFRVRRTDQPSDTIPVGNVISTDPSGTAEAGSSVQVFVSSGRAAVTVPNTINMTEGAARALLAQQNLQATSTQQASSTIGKGLVISSDPGVGASVPPGSTVILTVSAGPATVDIPEVVGLTKADATSTLKALGLKVTSVTTPVTDPTQDGIVLDSNPVQGDTATVGDTVTLTVGTLGGA
jgi:serine/threonine-protein kinase